MVFALLKEKLEFVSRYTRVPKVLAPKLIS